MYRISRCDICPANDPFYGEYLNLRKSPLLRPLDSMHILDVKFLIANWKHYNSKLYLASSDKIEKEHARKQCERIIWIFEQYGLSKEQFIEYLKYERDMYTMKKTNVENKKRRSE